MRLLFCLLLSVSTLYGQETPWEIYESAEKLYERQRYEKAADKFKEYLGSTQSKNPFTVYYQLARCYSMNGDNDSAMAYLNKAVNGGYKNHDEISNDEALIPLNPHKKWKEILLAVALNKEEADRKLNKPLAAMLDSIHQEDQNLRNELVNLMQQKGGRESEEFQQLVKDMNEKDSLNLIVVEKVLAEHGWLGEDVIGPRGNSALFLVIQHSDLTTQVKYLPMMREAVEKGNASAPDLAMLEDRILLRQGKRQIYGSQIHRDDETGEQYVAPLQNPENIAELRKGVGLPTIEEYCNWFGIKWDLEKHIERTKLLESKE